MSEEIRAYPWSVDTPPGGAAVWAVTVGHVRGRGDFRRANVLPHPFPHYVTRGSGVFISPYERREIGPGDLFCIWPGVPHEFYESPDDPWEFFWLDLIGDGAVDFVRGLGLSETVLVRHPPREHQSHRCAEQLFALYADPDPRDPYQALSLLYALGAAWRDALVPDTSCTAQLVRDAQTLINSQLGAGLNVSELAALLHVHRNALLAAFQTELGCSPIAYLRQARLDRAKDLLRHTSLRLADIAAACGYGHEKYFLRHFREAEGATPAAWRTSLGPQASRLPQKEKP